MLNTGASEKLTIYNSNVMSVDCVSVFVQLDLS